MPDKLVAVAMLKRIQDLMFRLSSNRTRRPRVNVNILDQYKLSCPSVQNALDIFEGEWTSRLPGEFANLRAGSLPLFDMHTIDWFVEHIGGICGKSILDLGPLEGGNAYRLERLGAGSVVAIEANARAYLKCLIVKEHIGLTRTRFHCGNFVEFLRQSDTRFDVCIASGVLYHMIHPAELIALIAKATDRVYLWTHYYAEPDPANSAAAMNVSHTTPAEHEGFRHSLHHTTYTRQMLEWKGFCGGGNSFRCLMSRNDILECLKYFGLTEIAVGWEDRRHPLGPAFALAALRS